MIAVSTLHEDHCLQLVYFSKIQKSTKIDQYQIKSKWKMLKGSNGWRKPNQKIIKVMLLFHEIRTLYKLEHITGESECKEYFRHMYPEFTFREQLTKYFMINHSAFQRFFYWYNNILSQTHIYTLAIHHLLLIPSLHQGINRGELQHS